MSFERQHTRTVTRTFLNHPGTSASWSVVEDALGRVVYFGDVSMTRSREALTRLDRYLALPVQEVLWRLFPRLRPPSPLTILRLVLVGQRGHDSVQVSFPREHFACGTNLYAIPLPRLARSTRWLLLDAEGHLIHEGHLRRAIYGVDVPAGMLRVVEDPRP